MRMADRWLASRLIERSRWHVPIGRRSCTRHPERPAEDRCDRCGQPFCAHCLAHIERWRVCTTCLGRLRRERQGDPLRARLVGVWRKVAAVLAIGGLMVGILVVISRSIGGAASDAVLGSTAHAVGPKVILAQQMGAPAAIPASLQLQVPLESASPPAHITLSGTGFQPDEQVRLTGKLSGQTGAGQVASVTLVLWRPLPSGAVQATSTGDLVSIVFTVPNSSRFFGGYHVQVQAIGNRGSRASVGVTAGGVPASRP